jgi:pyruvate dehydrogenase E2 component (dihydrolipoamide acetyltransferase)
MSTPVIMPRQGQSVESCILVEWLAHPGDKVEKGQILANIETDKAVFELESPETGTLLNVFFQDGDDIPVLTTIAAIGEPGEEAEAPQPGEAPPASKQNEPAAPTPVPEKVANAQPSDAAPVAAAAVSPRARRAAEKAGIDPTTLTGSGPRGRILERDVVQAASRQDRTPATSAPVSDPRVVARGPEEIPVRGIRKIVARRMHESLASTAQLTLSRTAEVTSILAFRAKMKAKAEKLGIPAFTINDLISYFVLRTLRRHPDVNAHFLGDRIIRYAGVNLGVAVDTERGLLVPVVHDADEMSLPELSRAIRTVAEKCRDGSIRPADMAGGTFTLTNLGALGIESFTPILNPPEVAILGVGGIILNPVRRGGEIEFVDSIHLSLTINHQAVDGAPGARYLEDLADSLAEPELAMMM